ncbi:glycolipid transfer protein 3-like isoform X1 [Malus sylvestris]|uniref:glycolipid transfer protein 3-like isoform X1 n=1 Tax=Malus sylvestris TaxID=3752 RepID=UPI0021AD342C|nr:glycolipid transfer protein 3-like isoform X1 [Malus sylvestris]
MKRKLMDQNMGSEIRCAIEELSVMVKVKGAILVPAAEHGGGDHAHEAAHIPTRPFLSLCSLLLQVLDKIGPTMAVLSQDIHQNIRRLETKHESDLSTYSNMVEMLKNEATEGIARNVTSCSRAFVWLTRSLDFTVALLQNLVRDPGQNMQQAVEESYNITLKPWHRWISSAASKVALMLVPDNETFISSLMAKDENYDNLKLEIENLVSLLVPYLEEIHSILVKYSTTQRLGMLLLWLTYLLTCLIILGFCRDFITWIG